ncbi:MAG TPA: hypothetical protein P5273_12165 [Syntrophomonadaceae bacterium]|nr:hypothetical protein [Syntrophomonadaceae bacterium]
MNAIKKMYEREYAPNVKRTPLHLVNDYRRNEEYVTVDGKTMTKHELNEKLAYFYANGGPVMNI